MPTNNPFDLIDSNKSTKPISIWETLKREYESDDAGNRKHVIGKWLRFQMVDDKSIMEQVNEYEHLVADVLNEGMKMCEVLQANVLLEKFPTSFKKEDLTFHQLKVNRKKDNKLSKGACYVYGKIIRIAVPLALTFTTIILFGSGRKYHHFAKPFWFAPLWFIHLATLGSSFFMGLAAWHVRANGGFEGESDMLYLYEAHLCLSIVWHPLVLVMSAYWIASVSCVVNFGTLFLCYLRFKRVNPFAKDLAKLCLVWAGYLTLVSFNLIFL